ncbi:MAG: leucyl/phenylalanyl-tRNA--protein transferase [Betaproteobacteria bacterium]|nr:leucyl/phenylalanyl-tRNA--protein transferase [Betaproteobacteria bacterium]
MIPWIERGVPFPSVEKALRQPNGLLCGGGDLSSERLIEAYRHGIFPWYAPGEPLLWWSPNPRMVLFPAELKVSRSLARTLKNADYQIRLDSAFAQVIAACAAPREEGGGTWISAEMQAAYLRLHDLGYAHSVETWMIDGGNRTLAGGLYGIAIGRVFYGESMFSRRTDASKIALAHLCRLLEQRSFAVIDCQMNTPHLASLGAREILRSEFVAGLTRWSVEGDAAGRWPMDAAQHLFRRQP